MNKSTNNDSTGTRDPGNQFTGGASGASGLKAGDSLKATDSNNSPPHLSDRVQNGTL